MKNQNQNWKKIIEKIANELVLASTLILLNSSVLFPTFPSPQVKHSTMGNAFFPMFPDPSGSVSFIPGKGSFLVD